MKTITEQIKSVKREIGLRRQVYPRFVDAKSLTADQARHEIECMEEVLKTLEQFKEKTEPLLF